MLGPAAGLILALAGGPFLPDGEARRILEAEGCQMELPIAGKPAASTTAAARQETRPGRSPGGAEASVPPAGVSWPRLGWLVAVAALAVGTLAAFMHRRPGVAPLLPPSPAAVRPRPAPEPNRPITPAGNPEQLAREGRFAEAIHALLLRAVAESDAVSGKPALTSRELLRSILLGREVQAALTALVAAVERVYFGGRPAGAAEYDASLAHYRQVHEAWRRRR
jgi:hypothetical protein